MFCDETTIKLTAGKGGDGCVAFHREKFIARGGPDGGDGGKGGSIILKADENINTLSHINSRKHYKADQGEQGRRNNMSGKMGEDLILKVPLGTIIYNPDKTRALADLSRKDQEFVVAKGGKGGLGNQHFATSVNQAPQFAENGEPGEETEVLLELKLVADVGLLGLPSVGKSTLISHISNARPKIAAYEFTTLIPNLGVVDMKPYGGGGNDSFVVADIPGLIEGASQGKGLGHKFLRHVSRTKILIHIIDPLRPNAVENFKKIQRELELFDKALAKTPLIIAINKVDAVQEKEIEKIEKNLREKIPTIKKTTKIFKISAVAGMGLKELLFEAVKVLKKTREKASKVAEKKRETTKEDLPVLSPHKKLVKFEIANIEKKKDHTVFTIKGERIEQLARMTDTKNLQGLERIYHFLTKMRAMKALKREKAKEGDIIEIADKQIPYRNS
jgi:GTPase